MTSEEIIAGNKLIAEYMGGIYRGNLLPTKSIMRRKKWEIPGHGYFDGDDFKYHSSWDWLMPVVEKINKEHESFELKFGNVNCYVKAFDYLVNPPVPMQLDPDMKVALYNTVVLFIKWLNDKK